MGTKEESGMLNVTCDNCCAVREDFAATDSTETIWKNLREKGWQEISIVIGLRPVLRKKEMLDAFGEGGEIDGISGSERFNMHVCPACTLTGLTQFKAVAQKAFADAMKSHRPAVEEALILAGKKRINK